MTDDIHLAEAIAIAERNVTEGGRPFGAVIVRDGAELMRAANEMHLAQDPTAHAELLAIRRACRDLGTQDLSGSTVYASGQPCAMCLAAMHLAGVSRVVFAGSAAEGEAYGLSPQRVYDEFRKPLSEMELPVEHRPVPDRIAALYRDWHARAGKPPAPT